MPTTPDTPQAVIDNLRRLVIDVIGEHTGEPAAWQDLLSSVEKVLAKPAGRETGHDDLQAIIDALPDLLLFVSNDGTILNYRLGNSAVVNLPAEIPFVRSIQDLPRIGPLFGQALREALETGKLTSIEYTLSYRGEPFHFEARFHPGTGQRVLILVRDVSKRKIAEDQLQERIVHFELLKALQNDLSQVPSAGAIMQRVEGLLPRFLGVDHAVVLPVDREKGTLTITVTGEGASGNILSLAESVPDAASAEAFRTGTPVAVPDVARSPFAGDPQLTRRRIKSMLAIPIRAKQELRGILRLDFIQRRRDFSPQEIEFCQMLGEQVGLMMENVDLFADWDSTREGLKRSTDRYQQLFNNMPVGLYHLNRAGLIVECNERFRQTFGFPPEMPLDSINLADLFLSMEDLDRWYLFLAGREQAADFETQMLRANGTTIWVRISTRASVGSHKETIGFEGFLEDITERRASDERLKSALEEKGILLKEIHHRVKNNLQIISSLLNLQSAHLHDPLDVQMFRQSQDRVKAMSLLHERLYRSANFAAVDFAEYLHSLVSYLGQSYKTGTGPIDLIVDAQAIQLDIDTAMPCGLIVGELVSNALKYAFPGDRSGEIRLSLRRDGEGMIILCVEDNGVGSAQVDRAAGSIGLDLVETLGTQLNASITTESGERTRVRIAFRETKQP